MSELSFSYYGKDIETKMKYVIKIEEKNSQCDGKDSLRKIIWLSCALHFHFSFVAQST